MHLLGRQAPYGARSLLRHLPRRCRPQYRPSLFESPGRAGGLPILIKQKHGIIAISIDVNNQPTDEQLKQFLTETKKKRNIEQIQCLLLDKTNKKMIAGYSHIRKNFYVARYEPLASQEDVQPLMGYWIAPQQLWNEFNNNELVAQEMYDNKNLIIVFKTEGVSLDFNKQPYIRCSLEQPLSSLQVKLSKDDKFVRELKKGQTVGVRAKVKSFDVGTIFLEGKIIHIVQGK